jgi:transcriptional regulator with XRE-family HTH domain
MKYGQLIQQLFDRSGLGVKEYAEEVGCSTTTMSNVLNDKISGSLKLYQACLRREQLDVNDLRLPGEESQGERDIISKLLFILRNDADGARGITVNVEYIYEEARRRVHRAKAERSLSGKRQRA